MQLLRMLAGSSAFDSISHTDSSATHKWYTRTIDEASAGLAWSPGEVSMRL